MADYISLGLDGVMEWIEACRGMDAEMQAETVALVKDEAPRILDRFQRSAPISRDRHHGHEPGNLRKGLRVRVEEGGLTMRFRSTAPHSHLVEFGTVHWPGGHPFFIETAVAERQNFRGKVLHILRKPRPAVGDGIPDVIETDG